MRNKKNINDLALLGGSPVFSKIRSTSNLVKPDVEIFLKYTKKSFDKRWLTNNGPLVQELECRLAELHQVRHCVSFCSGFWGLVLCIDQLSLPGKKEIVMPGMTYRRLADIAAWVNKTPHFCDVCVETLGPSVKTVDACITKDTGLLLIAQPIVHICDMEGLVDLARNRNVPILFDSVEAAYASLNGKMIGSFGDAECFSMHASKLINGFEGGYMTTDNTKSAESIKTMRAFGFSKQDNVVMMGLNAKLNELHAAMALACLDDLDSQITRNKARYNIYCHLLSPIEGLNIVPYNQTEKRGYKNILVELNEHWPIAREATLKILHSENMLARPYYFPPLHTKKTDYETISADLPTAELLTKRYLLLPSGEFVSDHDIQAIASLLNFIQDNGALIANTLGKNKDECKQ